MKQKHNWEYWEKPANLQDLKTIWQFIVILTIIVFLIVVVVLVSIVSPAKAVESPQVQEKAVYSVPDPCGLIDVVCDDEVATSEVNDSKLIHNATVYAYNSEIGQTDSTPFITASGHNLSKGDRVVANNCLAFGTVVVIQGVEYQVQDRMNVRYTKCGENDTWVFDIWFLSYTEAANFGKKTLDVKILL